MKMEDLYAGKFDAIIEASENYDKRKYGLEDFPDLKRIFSITDTKACVSGLVSLIKAGPQKEQYKKQFWQVLRETIEYKRILFEYEDLKRIQKSLTELLDKYQAAFDQGAREEIGQLKSYLSEQIDIAYHQRLYEQEQKESKRQSILIRCGIAAIIALVLISIIASGPSGNTADKPANDVYLNSETDAVIAAMAVFSEYFGVKYTGKTLQSPSGEEINTNTDLYCFRVIRSQSYDNVGDIYYKGDLVGIMFKLNDGKCVFDGFQVKELEEAVKTGIQSEADSEFGEAGWNIKLQKSSVDEQIDVMSEMGNEIYHTLYNGNLEDFMIREMNYRKTVSQFESVYDSDPDTGCKLGKIVISAVDEEDHEALLETLRQKYPLLEFEYQSNAL